MPYAVSIEPTNHCNLSCIACPTGNNQISRVKGNLSTETFRTILQQIKNHSFYLNLFLQGEPLLHPDLGTLLQIANSYNFFTCISTNAQLLDESTANLIIENKCGKIIISLDALNDEDYKKYRKGGSYSKVIQGITNLIKARQNKKSKLPIIELQVLLTSYNENLISEFKAKARELGADYIRFKSMQVYEVNTEILPSNEKYNRYKNENGTLIIKSHLPNHCRRIFTTAVFTFEGRLIPCCFDKDANYVMGEAGKTKSFREIWNGKSFNGFRKQVFEERKSIDICTNCTEGLKNRFT